MGDLPSVESLLEGGYKQRPVTMRERWPRRGFPERAWGWTTEFQSFILSLRFYDFVPLRMKGQMEVDWVAHVWSPGRRLALWKPVLEIG